MVRITAEHDAPEPRHAAYQQQTGMVSPKFMEFRAAEQRLDGKEKGNRSMKYKVVIQHSEEGYSVSVPGLPGCWSQGATEEEAMENIRDAIREYMAAVNDLYPDGEVREIEVSM